MEKHILALLGVVMLASLLLSGCQSQSAVVNDQSSKIQLDAHGLVKFVNSSLLQTTDKSKNVVSEKVSWMFENIAGRTISIKIDIQFMDVANHLLYNESKFLYYMNAGYKEQTFTPANYVTLSGVNAAKVDHVVIEVTEIK